MSSPQGSRICWVRGGIVASSLTGHRTASSSLHLFWGEIVPNRPMREKKSKCAVCFSFPTFPFIDFPSLFESVTVRSQCWHWALALHLVGKDGEKVVSLFFLLEPNQLNNPLKYWSNRIPEWKRAEIKKFASSGSALSAQLISLLSLFFRIIKKKYVALRRDEFSPELFEKYRERERERWTFFSASILLTTTTTTHKKKVEKNLCLSASLESCCFMATCVPPAGNFFFFKKKKNLVNSCRTFPLSSLPSFIYVCCF